MLINWPTISPSATHFRKRKCAMYVSRMILDCERAAKQKPIQIKIRAEAEAVAHRADSASKDESRDFNVICDECRRASIAV